MSRIDELVERLCPDGVEYRALGEIGKFYRGSSFQKKHFVKSGTPCIHYGQIHTRFDISTNHVVSYLDEDFAAKMKRASHSDLIIATTSEDDVAVGKAIAWLGEEDVVVSNDAYIYRHGQNPKYLSYLFDSRLFQDSKRPFVTGTKVRRLSDKSMSQIRFPVPPMEVQQEVVRILDSFAELEAELQARRRQYAHYRDKMLDFSDSKSVAWLRLGDVFRVTSAKRIAKSEWAAQGVPFYRLTDVADLIAKGSVEPTLFISEERYEQLLTSGNVPQAGDLLVTARGTLGKCHVVKKSDSFYFQDGMIAWLQRKAISPSSVYIKYLFSSDRFLSSLAKSPAGTVSYLSNRSLSETIVPIPPLEEQECIVAILDKFDTLVNDISQGIPAEIEARRKQYAYYRDKLLSFKEKGV